MKILVVGGAGFIGSHFIEWSIQNRPEVSLKVLDNLTYASISLPTIQSLGVEVIVGDIRDSEVLEDLVSWADVVVNFAAESHNDNSLLSPMLFFETNILGAANLARACAKRGVRLHQVSTDEVFGDIPLDVDHEFTAKSPYNPSSPYSASKAGADLAISAWGRSFGLQYTISICSNNYGPRQHHEKLIPRTVSRLRAGLRPIVYGTGLQVRDWIHVLDHVEGIWAILDHGALGNRYLIGAGCRKSNLEVVGLLNVMAGRTAEDVEFTRDRPGHDQKYALSPDPTLALLGWSPKRVDFKAQLENLWETS
jgi:dTDP-glucose 4,6-dehydratase